MTLKSVSRIYIVPYINKYEDLTFIKEWAKNISKDLPIIDFTIYDYYSNKKNVPKIHDYNYNFFLNNILQVLINKYNKDNNNLYDETFKFYGFSDCNSIKKMIQVYNKKIKVSNIEIINHEITRSKFSNIILYNKFNLILNNNYISL